MDYSNPKKEDLIPGKTYLVCPDSECSLFADFSGGKTACEQDCPKQSKLLKIILCPGCNELVELPAEHQYDAETPHSCNDHTLKRNFRPIWHVRIFKKPE